MKALIVAMLVAQVADAPLAVTDQPLDNDATAAVVALPMGHPAPFAGVLLTEEQAERTAGRVAAAEAERDALKAAPVLRPWVVVLVGVLAAGAAVAVTVGVYEGIKAKQPAP